MAEVTGESTPAKVCIIGARGVGKTSLLAAFRGAAFEPTSHNDVCSFQTVTVELDNGTPVAMQLWDVPVPSSAMMEGPARMAVRGAVACIFVYDANRPDTLSALESRWRRYFIEAASQYNFPCIVFGNQSDLGCAVPASDVERFASDAGDGQAGDHFLGSAKTGVSVREALVCLAKKLAPTPAETATAEGGAGAVPTETVDEAASNESSDAASGGAGIAATATASETEAAAAEAPEFKVCLVGPRGVGKTSLLKRFNGEDCPAAPDHNDVASFNTTTVEVDGRPVKLQFWDIPATTLPMFEGAARMSVRGAKACIFVYDVNKPGTLAEIKSRWGKSFPDLSGAYDLPCIVFGNQSDLGGSVPESDVQDFAADAGTGQAADHVVGSAKTGDGIREAAQLLARKLAPT